MTLEERFSIAEELRGVLQRALAPNLCTGTGKEFRERKHEMTRLMARVSAVVMYDGLPASEQAFRTKRLENEAVRIAEDVGQHVWQAGGGRKV